MSNLNSTEEHFQSQWVGSADGQAYESGYGEGRRTTTAQVIQGRDGHTSVFANNLYGFFCSLFNKQTQVREGHEGVKKIFKDFDDANKWFGGIFGRKSNDYFDEDIKLGIHVVTIFFKAEYPQLFGNYHILIYMILRFEQ